MNDGHRGHTVELFRDNFAAAHASAERLAWSLARLAPLFPIGADEVMRLDPEQEVTLDALLYRFASLSAMIRDRLFRGVALLEDEPLAGRSKRDLIELMERFDVVPSARRFAAIAALGNELRDGYPFNPEKQAERLNDAYGTAPELLQILDAIRDHVTAKGLADLGGFGPVAPPPVSRRPSA